MPNSDARTVTAHELAWMSPRAPYMPVACVGLLEALQGSDPLATVGWVAREDPYVSPVLTFRTALMIDEAAEAIVAAPWPDLADLEWKIPPSQAIKPTLQKLNAQDDGDSGGAGAVSEWRRLAGHVPEPPEGNVAASDQTAAQRLIAALLTDGALDDKGLPGRSRLLRGVKADLSGVAKPPRMRIDEIADELANGPQWTSGSSGLGLGLVPEVQTFGGTTGPTPSAVGAYSKLLYRLCWLGITAMPPFGVTRGPQTVVGGPLFANADTMSWPVWTASLQQSALIGLFGLAPIHAPNPDRELLRAHGIDAVFRSRAREINTMISVFGWGDRVA